MTKARQQIVGHLVAHGALTPAHAIALDTGCPKTARLLRRMRRHGAIAEAAPGRYWLDADRLGSFRGAVRRRVALWVGTSGITVVTATAMAFGG